MVSLSTTGIFSVWFYPSKGTSAPFSIVLFTCMSPLSLAERWSSVTGASWTQNKRKGLLKSDGCSLPLLKGRSTKGLNLDRTSARCERFQSFLCMSESSGKHLLTNWLTVKRGEKGSAENHPPGWFERKHDCPPAWQVTSHREHVAMTDSHCEMLL